MQILGQELEKCGGGHTVSQTQLKELAELHTKGFTGSDLTSTFDTVKDLLWTDITKATTWKIVGLARSLKRNLANIMIDKSASGLRASIRLVPLSALIFLGKVARRSKMALVQK